MNLLFKTLELESSLLCVLKNVSGPNHTVLFIYLILFYLLNSIYLHIDLVDRCSKLINAKTLCLDLI